MAITRAECPIIIARSGEDLASKAHEAGFNPSGLYLKCARGQDAFLQGFVSAGDGNGKAAHGKHSIESGDVLHAGFGQLRDLHAGMPEHVAKPAFLVKDSNNTTVAYATEYVDGDLIDHLRMNILKGALRRPPITGTSPEVARYLKTLNEVLQVMTRLWESSDLAHGDLHTRNVIAARDGTIKLIDPYAFCDLPTRKSLDFASMAGLKIEIRYLEDWRDNKARLQIPADWNFMAYPQ